MTGRRACGIALFVVIQAVSGAAAQKPSSSTQLAKDKEGDVTTAEALTMRFRFQRLLSCLATVSRYRNYLRSLGTVIAQGGMPALPQRSAVRWIKMGGAAPALLRRMERAIVSVELVNCRVTRSFNVKL